MSEKVTKQQVLDIKTDLKLLLECMSYQKDNPSALKQALVTVSSILQSFNEAKDIFRDTGGLQSVLDTVTSTRYGEVTEAGLYCLGSAVERNVYSQKLLSTASTFTFIHSLLSDVKGTSVRKKQTAAFLILCLVSNNGFGQNLARQSSCLHDIISLIRTSLPKDTGDNSPSEWLEGLEGTSLELWSALVSTACVCVNNPQNEENQRICAVLFPYLFSLLQDQINHKIVRPVLSLVGLTVANNVQNQDRVRKCGGLDIFVRLLKKLVSRLDSDSDCKTTAIHLLNTLDSCIADNEENAKRIGMLGALPVMLKMLSNKDLGDEDKTQIILTLAHAADIYEENQNSIRDSGGITSLIQQLTLTESEELSKTVKYLLRICVSSDQAVTLDTDENNNLSDVEPLVMKMERMKKHNDIQMLQKINDLDEKLRSMEKEASERQELIKQLTSAEPVSQMKGSSRNIDSGKGAASVQSLPLYREETSQYNETPMTPREKTLLAQLNQEKKEKLRLENLNQMLQENMHVCLTQFVTKGDNNKTAGVETSIACPRTPGGDACELHSSMTAEPISESFHQGKMVANPTQMSTENNQSFKNSSGVCNTEENCPSCDHNKTFVVGQIGETNRCIKNKPYRERTIGLKNNTDRNEELMKYDFVGDAETYTALPRKNLNFCCQNNYQVQKGAPCSVTRSILEDKTYKNSKQHNNVTSNLHVTDVTGGLDHEQIHFKSCQHGPQSENMRNVMLQNSLVTKQLELSDHCCDVSRSKVVENQENVDFNNNDMAAVCPGHNKNYNKMILSTASDSYIQSVNGIDTNIHSQNSTDPASNLCGNKNKQQCVGTTSTRVLQVHNLEPIVMLERISAGDITPKIATDKPLVHCKVLDKLNSVNNIDMHKCNTDTIEKMDNIKNNTAETHKNKAKQVLLEYTKTISKSTCTTPSLSKIATEKSTQSSKVQNSSGSISSEVLSNKKDGLQQTDNKTRNTEATDTENEKLFNQLQSQTTDKFAPSKAKAISNGSTDTFIKPLATAPRRKVRMTPKLGSDILPQAIALKVNCKTKSQAADTEQNDVESEFDFKLLQTFRQTKQKCYPGSSNFDSTSEISLKNIPRKVFTKECVTNSFPVSSQNKCSGWCVTPQTPDKQRCVPPRPAFSDSGSRRPVFDSPLSVKSVGKLAKRTLDDSGIYSPGNNLNVSPGGSSGSPEALSDISSYFENMGNGGRDEQERRTRKAQQITMYRKQDKCPGCQEPLKIGCQLLNSRTYNIVIETDPNTCSFHRKLRHLERLQIHQTRKNKMKKNTKVGLFKTLRADLNRKKSGKKRMGSVYNFESDASEMLSPPCRSSDEEGKTGHFPSRPKRRRRIAYTEAEEQNLMEGVRKMGKFWTQILLTYQFHPSRTAVDLKDKYKSMMKSSETRSVCSSVRSRSFKPFSMCEERRLRRGIKKFGYNWKTILTHFTFSRGRTAEDLRNRWRCMHRKDIV